MSTSPPLTPDTFHQRILAPWWVKLLGAVILLVPILVAVVMLLDHRRPFVDDLYAHVSLIVGALIAVAVGLAAVLNRIDIAVSEVSVTLRFRPIWSVTLTRDDIRDVRSVRVSPREFGGFGLRRVPGKRVGMFYSGGAGVEIIRRSDGLSYVVRTDEADALIAAIKR